MEKSDDQQTGFEKALKRIAAIILALGAIIGGITAAIKYTTITAEKAKFILAALNLLVLIIYCVLSTRVRKQKFKVGEEAKTKYCELLDVNSGEAERKLGRVNLVVKQLHTNIILYAICLIIVYLVYLVDNEFVLRKLGLLTSPNYERVHKYFEVAADIFNYASAVFIFLAFKVLYDKTIDDDDETPRRYYINEAIFSIIFLAVYLIYSIPAVSASLEKADRPASIAMTSVVSITDTYKEDVKKERAKTVTVYQKLLDAHAANNPPLEKLDDEVKKQNEEFDKQKASQDVVIDQAASKSIAEIRNTISPNNPIGLNLLKLFVGIFNGLAMALLFGRYISMEHSAYIMGTGVYFANSKWRNIIHACTIFILPVYALAQPLFGSFEIDAFGDRAVFANFVFFFCLIGKVWFLTLTHLFMKQRLMHLYLHSTVNSHGIPKKLAECFKPSR